MFHRRAQISMEFIMIFALILTAFVGFLSIAQMKVTDISEEKEDLLIRTLANSIKKEVVLATQVHNNYIRRFKLPLKLNDRDYNMYIVRDELIIELYDESGNILQTGYAILPTEVKGGFVEDKDPETLDHCITKSRFDGVRIARNQVSLDVDTTGFDLNSAGNPKIPEGALFDVYARINCVKDIKSLQFTIKYDPDYLKLVNVMSLDAKNSDSWFFRNSLIVFNFTEDAVSTANGNLQYISDTDGRYTYSTIGEECSSGSGNVARLRFRTLGGSGSTNTSIGFDPDFNTAPDLNIVVLDCSTSHTTLRSLPSTDVEALVEIITP